MTARNPAATTASGLAPALVVEAWQVLHDHTPTGMAVLSNDLRYVAVNASFAARNGIPAAEHIGRTARQVVPDLAEVVQNACAHVLATGTPVLDLCLSGTVASTPGRVRHWIENIYPVFGPDRTTAGIAILVWEVTDRHRAEREATARGLAEAHAARLLVLHRLAAALADATDADQIANLVVDIAERTLEAQTASIARLEGPQCRILAAAGATSGNVGRLRKPFPITVNPILSAVVGSPPRTLHWSSLADKDLRYPSTSGRMFTSEAGAIAPLLVDGAPVGFVGVGWAEQRLVGPADIELLETVAAQTVAALERARLFDAEHRAQRHLRLLADVSAELACAGVQTQQLTRLANLLLSGGFADFVSVLLPDDTGLLRRTIVVSADPELDAIVRCIVDTPIAEDDPRMTAWHTGQPAMVAISDPGQYAADAGLDTGQASRIRQTLGTGCTIAVPFGANGQRLGMFITWRGAERTPYDQDDLHLLAEVGRRASVAIDNLRLLAAQTRIATRLQQSLLPDALPRVDGLELAAGYLAAEHHAEVGGDFYDVFAVDNAYALVIGDVSGRGIDAAGLTGTARIALRTLADHLPPSAILARLNTLLTERGDDGQFLTLALLMVYPDPHGATVHTWLAGHHPAQVVHPDGTVTELGCPGTLLGILPTVTHHRHVCHLDPGDLLLLYTDGLTEAHGPQGLFGQSLLPTHLRRLAGSTAAAAVAHLTEAVTGYRGDTSADDTAILAMHLPAVKESSMIGPGEPFLSGMAR